MPFWQSLVPAILQEMSDERVELGHAIFSLMQPHAGHELAWNRWYERDHLIAAGSLAPYTMATQRWLATAPHKAIREPRQNPIANPSESGTFLATMWIQKNHLADQQAWVAEQMKRLAEQDRTYEERDVLFAGTWDYLGGALRDPDGVPPELVLDHRYSGLVLTWLECSPGQSLEELRDALLHDALPDRLENSAVAQALCFTPLPKSDWWPKAAPEVPGVGVRILVACFVESDPLDIWQTDFADLGKALEDRTRGRSLLIAPFVPVVPGVDPDIAQL